MIKPAATAPQALCAAGAEAHVARAAARATPAPVEEPGAICHSKKVLIVDDEVSIVEVVSSLLEDAGREVLRAYDGTQALALAREHRPCIIVTDLMMPIMDGGALIRAVRDEPELAETSIVLMSAASRARLEQIGADVVLPKPFNLDVLDDVLNSLLATKV